MAAAMKETSWRTLMLLTTLFILVVIVQSTVRTPRLRVAVARPADGIDLSQEPNETPTPETPAPAAAATVAARAPAVVRVVAQSFGTWEDDEPEDESKAPNESGEAPPAVPE
jgi:hypothetical protein